MNVLIPEKKDIIKINGRVKERKALNKKGFFSYKKKYKLFNIIKTLNKVIIRFITYKYYGK